MKREILCGTYGKGEGNGIYRFFLEDGKLSEPVLFCRIDGAKYLTSDGNRIYSLFSNDDGAGVAVIDPAGNVVSSLIFEEVSSCFIGYDDGLIRCANYHEGTYSFISCKNDELKIVRKVVIGKGAGCHQLIPYKSGSIGACLKRDEMYIFDENFEIIRTVRFPEGSGPRHAAFSDDGRYMFVAAELSDELFALDTDDFRIIDQIKLSESGVPAAIRLQDDLICVSVREADLVCRVKFSDGRLRIVDIHSCGGRHPRDMIVSDGCEICANLQSDSVTCIRDGKVTSEIRIPQAVSLTIR
ncbi:MAG: beta-propeller fold lactonase family protein [Erysipelotrichaceae bacterium]|nr:beta-propeller fold lactonase family protein [Erysipelotrichaceae bacterium]